MWANARRTVVGTVVLVVIMLAGFRGVASAADHRVAHGTQMTGAEVARMLAAGRSFREQDLRIQGDLDLSGLSVVVGSFRCASCTFEGSLSAPDTEFRDVVDLAGSQIHGGIDMQGAIFDRSVVLTRANIGGDARFDTTVFAPTASFDRMTFSGATSFTGARFQGGATFDATDFSGRAEFSGATFLGDALFGGMAAGRAPGATSARCRPSVAGTFDGPAVFADVAIHGRADFGSRCFAGTADFSGITINGRTDFDAADFVGTAMFEGASFSDDASFTLAIFDEDASFAGVSATRNLTFEAADFGPDLDLDRAAIGGTLSLATPIPPSALNIDDAIVGGLVLDPGAVGVIIDRCTLLPCTQVTSLQKIEETARASGDSATANDARYDWLQLAGQARLNKWRSGSLPWIGVWLQDRVFYRWIAGYLVRPLSPALVLGVLLGFGILVRVFRRPQPAKPADHEPKPGAPATRSPAPRPGQTAQATGISAGATPGVTEHDGVVSPGLSLATASVLAEPPTGGGSPAHLSPTGSAPAPPGASSGVTPRRERGRRDPSHWIRAFLDASAVAFAPRPPDELKNATRDPVGVSRLALAAVRWMEYAGFKGLTVLIITCVANYNATLHQFIESIIHP